MIIIVCTQCGVGVRTHGEDTDVLVGQSCEWYPNKYPCPVQCGGQASCAEVESLSLPALDIHDLTPQEAFAAFEGLGFPEEHDCGKAAVERLFVEQRVKSVKVVQLRHQNRSRLDHIEFENGTKLYLAAATEGAVVYRISNPHSYAEAVSAVDS